MIPLTLYGGRPALVNPALVVMVRPTDLGPGDGMGTDLHLPDGSIVAVRETVAEVQELLEEATHGS